MHPVKNIKEEHAVIKRMLSDIMAFTGDKINRTKLSSLLQKFESFWSQHEEKEDKYFNWLSNHGEEFPFHKTIISQHQELKGHWKILKDYTKDKNDKQLKIALETDGKMLVDKFTKHIAFEEQYLEKNFKKA